MAEEIPAGGKIPQAQDNTSAKEPELVPLPQESAEAESAPIPKTMPVEDAPGGNIAIPKETEPLETLAQKISSPAKTSRGSFGGQGNLVGQEKLPEVKPPVAPATQSRTSISPFIRPIRTYKDDVAESVKSKKTSLVRMVIAESERRETETEIESPRSKRNLIFISLSAVLFILGASGGIYVFNKYRGADEPVPITEDKAASLIFAETQKEIPVTGRSSASIIQAFAAEITGANIRLDTIEHISPTEETAEGKARPSAQRFFFFLDNRMPANLLRSLTPDFMLGVHAFNGNQPFLILTTDYYENSFAGLLTWERYMARDLLPLFGINKNEDDPIFERPFQDRVVKNRDARILYDDLGQIIIMYVFKDKRTVIVTTSENTLDEVVKRLNASGAVTR